MLLVGWQEGHPACKKTEWWGVGMVICLEQGADLHMAQLMPLPLTVSCVYVCVCTVYTLLSDLSVDCWHSRKRKYADTVGTVPVPWDFPFQC